MRRRVFVTDDDLEALAESDFRGEQTAVEREMGEYREDEPSDGEAMSGGLDSHWRKLGCGR